MFTATKTATTIIVQIVLSNGTIAGTGFASTVDNATAFAIADARFCGLHDAANGHARIADHFVRSMTGLEPRWSNS